MFFLFIAAILIATIIILRVREGEDGVLALEERFPLFKVERDMIIAKNGDITACFRLELPEIFSLATSEYSDFHDYWVKAIKILPSGITLHKQDWFSAASYSGGNNGSGKNSNSSIVNTQCEGDPQQRQNDPFIENARGGFFKRREHLHHECLLFITIPAGGSRPSKSAASNLIKKSIISSHLVDKKQMQQTLQVISQFKKILTSNSFIKMQQLKGPEITGTREAPGILERYLFLLGSESSSVPSGGTESAASPSRLSEDLAKINNNPSAARKPTAYYAAAGSGASGAGSSSIIKDIRIKPHLQIGSVAPQLFTLSDVSDLPEAVSPRRFYEKYGTSQSDFSIGFASPLGLLLPVSHVYNQYIRILDRTPLLKKLELKRRRLESLSVNNSSNKIGAEAVASYIDKATSENKGLVSCHYNVLVWSEDNRDPRALSNTVAAAISQVGAVPHLETLGAPQIWWAGIPGNAGALPTNECFLSYSEEACCLLNLESAYRSSKSSFGIKLGDRLSGVPVHVDLSDEPIKKGIITNRNKIVVGGSGSGKSMFMNHLLHSYVVQGAHCVVVDVGHSYEGLCALLDGYYFTYTEQKPIAFNPFYIEKGAALDTEKKESIKTLLVALWKQGDESFRRSEYVAISNALTGYYSYLSENPGVFPCFNSFYEYLQSGFRKELSKDSVKPGDFDMDNFLYVLRPYYKGGEFDYLLNSRAQLDLMQQPFIVFELDNIKDHPILFPVITLIIMELFIAKMRRLKGVRKVIVIEEAWKAIARSGMAEFMKYLYKTVRKYYGEAVTVTQEIDDIISSPIIKEAIINNADCKILLDMKKFQNKFDRIQEVLGMTDKGRDLVLSINRANDPNRKYREVYIELGSQIMKVYRYEPCPEEYYGYSTEQTDKVLVEKYKKRYQGDIKKALSALVKDLKS